MTDRVVGSEALKDRWSSSAGTSGWAGLPLRENSRNPAVGLEKRETLSVREMVDPEGALHAA